MAFRRFRPLRQDQVTRDKNTDTSLSPHDFIMPYFVVEGKGLRKKIPSLKDIYHLSIDELCHDVRELLSLDITKVLLFGSIDPKLNDETGSHSYHENSIVAQAVKALKACFPELTVITDICICGYTSHGHCGLVGKDEILNDETLPILSEMALTHAIAGADCVAPSAMMDGQVSAIRYKLDEHGFKKVKILAYSAKYASSFYGPFRDAIDSKPSFSDRRSYQMDLRNASQAIDEVCADIEEGADSVMVKPAHTYLDILHRIHLEFPDVPLVAYHVSGEYMMIQHAAESGALDVQQAFEEVFYGFKRAGATMIISYYAKKYILSLKKRMTKLNMSLQGAI